MAYRIRHALSGLRRQFGRRRRYRGLGDWLLSLYNRVLFHTPRWPWPGRRRLIAVRPSGVDEPFHVRLGTSDWYVVEEICFDGEYQAVDRNCSRDSRVVVDLGANIGVSIRHWKAIFPGCRILAVEPDLENCQLLERNARSALADGSVRVVRACVGARPREVVLDKSRGDWAIAMREAGENSGPSVPVLTLPQLLGQWGEAGMIDLLKCDIEGAEAELFGDCAAWIQRVRALVIELHHPYSLDQLRRDLERAGARFEVQQTGKAEVVFLRQVVAGAAASPALART